MRKIVIAGAGQAGPRLGAYLISILEHEDPRDSFHWFMSPTKAAA